MQNPLVLISALMLTAVFMLPFIRQRTDKRGGYDLFRPDRLAAILLGLRVIPFIVVASFDIDSIVDHRLLLWIDRGNIDIAIVKFALIQAAGFAMLMLATRIRYPIPRFGRLRFLRSNTTVASAALAAVISGCLGIIAAGVYITKIGGLSYILENLGARSRITAGHAYLSALYSTLLSISVALLIYAVRTNPSVVSKFAVLIWAFAVAVLLSITGGRSGTLELVFLITLTWHYCVRPIKRVGLGAVVTAVAVAMYIVVVPILRAPGGLDMLLDDPSTFAEMVGGKLNAVASGNQYVPIQLFIQQYFSIDNVWAGKSYLDLLYAPLPRLLYADKPPVDDGVYIFNLLSGRQVQPSLPLSAMSPNSWPPATLGAGYMNFGVPGALIGMFLLGMIYKWFYMGVQDSKYSLLPVVLYGTVMWRFQLSNLGIAAGLTEVVFVVVLWLVVARSRLLSQRALKGRLHTVRVFYG